MSFAQQEVSLPCPTSHIALGIVEGKGQQLPRPVPHINRRVHRPVPLAQQLVAPMPDVGRALDVDGGQGLQLEVRCGFSEGEQRPALVEGARHDERR